MNDLFMCVCCMFVICVYTQITHLNPHDQMVSVVASRVVSHVKEKLFELAIGQRQDRRRRQKQGLKFLAQAVAAVFARDLDGGRSYYMGPAPVE